MFFKEFEGQNMFDFFAHFATEDDCKSYLAYYKWRNGFVCSICGGIVEHNSNEPFTKRCQGCLHKESVTSGTLFHKVKFELRKAFYIVFEMTTTTKGSSSPVLAKKLGINQKTAWKFSQKVRVAMKSSQVYPLKGKIEVDETYIGGEDKQSRGRNSGTKTPVVIAIEKNKNEDGIKRAYAQVIDNTSCKELKKIFEKHIDKNAETKTDKWSGYLPLMKDWNIEQEKSNGGVNFELMHRFIMGLKSWIRGIYHKISPEHLQKYLDEYCYRFNRSIFKNTIFDKMIARMVNHSKVEYIQFKLCSPKQNG